MKLYPNLFKAQKKEEGRFDIFNPSKQIDSRFKWHNMISKFIQELNMKENEVYEMNYISSLNWLSYFDNRDEVIKNIK